MRYALMALAALLLLAAPARAELPSKTGLVAAWEEHIAQAPHTVSFEKTEEDGVYAYETTLFPYKGLLRVTNAFTAARDPYDYYGAEAAPVGIVEAVLPGMTKEDMEKIPYSLAEWNKGNRFYYSDGAWISQDAWFAKQREVAATPPPSCAPAATGNLLHRTLGKVIGSLASILSVLIAVLILLLPLLLLQRKRVKKYNEMNQTIMDRQKRAVMLAEENTALLREQVALLRELAGKN